MEELEFSPALSEVPPWMLPFPVINTELLKEKRDYQDYQSFAKYGQIFLSSLYYGYLKIFTNGSKN